MVLPLAVDPQVSRRVALQAKVQTLHEANRADVVRLDVRLDSVEPVFAERPIQYRDQARPHEAVSLIRRDRIVAEEPVLEGAMDDRVDVDHACQLARVLTYAIADTDVRWLAQVLPNLRFCGHWCDPRLMESTATDDGLEEFWGMVSAKKSNADHSSTSIVPTTYGVDRRCRLRRAGRRREIRTSGGGGCG